MDCSSRSALINRDNRAIDSGGLWAHPAYQVLLHANEYPYNERRLDIGVSAGKGLAAANTK